MEEDKTTTTMDITTGWFVHCFFCFFGGFSFTASLVLLGAASGFFLLFVLDVVDAVADPPADGTAGLYGSK